MRNKVLFVCVFIALALAVQVQAKDYTFSPGNNGLGSLDHCYYYSWGIDWSVPSGEEIVDAYLTIDNINDWTQEANDRLFIHLLDNPSRGVRSWYDNQGNGDNWADKNKNALGLTGPLVATYTDGNNYNEDLVYRFSSLGLLEDLREVSKTKPGRRKANFGLGFDPDCHYINSNVKLTIQTAAPAVPEPSGLLVIFSGLSSVAGVMKLRRKR
ncbi:MAG: PEP-CTERM sorting domain-containing protein [Armatimonadota bacterium]